MTVNKLSESLGVG